MATFRSLEVRYVAIALELIRPIFNFGEANAQNFTTPTAPAFYRFSVRTDCAMPLRHCSADYRPNEAGVRRVCRIATILS